MSFLLHTKTIKRLFFLIIIGLYFSAFAQDDVMLRKIKKLEQEYPVADLSKRAEIELALSEYYWMVDPEKGISYGKRAIDSYRKLGDQKMANAYVNTAICFYYCSEMDSCIKYVEEMLAIDTLNLSDRKLGVSNNILCVAYRRTGAYEPALKYGRKAIAYFEKIPDSMQIASTLDNLSLIYRKWGKYEEAMNYSIKSLRIQESLQDTSEMAITLANIGDLFLKMKKYDDARFYYEQSLHFSKAIGFHLLLADVYSQLGWIAQKKNELDSALALYDKAMLLYTQTDNKEGLAVVQQNIGSVMVAQGRSKEGIAHLRESERFFEAVNSKEDIAEVSIDLGNAYNSVQQNDSALAYLKVALQISRELKNINLRIKSLKSLHHVFADMKDFQNAYQYQQMYYQLNDSVHSSEVELKLAELSKEYNLEKAQRETEQWKRQQQEADAKRRLFKTLFVGLLLFIVLAAYFIWQRRKKDREIIALRQERNRMLRDEMQQKMHYQSKQLTTHALNMLQKNKLLQSLQDDIDRIGQKAKEEVKPELRSLNQKIKIHLKGEKDWDLFKMYFEQINKEFFSQLKAINPNLTSNDLRLLALIKLNMNIKEVASVLNLSPDSVKNARYRLRKKLNLNPQDDLFEFVNALG